MTIKDLYQEYLIELKDLYQTGEADAISKIMFEHFAKTSQSDMIVNAKNEINDDIQILLQNALAQLKQHVPVQYITGQAWFYNLSFEVDNAVLIPRPETEELVLEAIHFLKENTEKKVLDIGTGSGCIPISIKKNVTKADVTSIDVSKSALDVAKRNAALNSVKIDFLKLNFLDENNHADLPSYNLIISNPPYIPEKEKDILDKNVTAYEPHLALFVPDNDHLIFYRKIVIFAANHLKINGRILLEIHEDFAAETAALFLAEKYTVEIKKDMQGKDRMLIIYRCR